MTQRSVRETFDKLMKDFLKKESEEKKQSGVDVEYGELDQDMKERMAEFEELRGRRGTKAEERESCRGRNEKAGD